MRVAVVGLGKLGAPLAGVYARAGHTVIGVDKNQETITKINAGIAPVAETGLQAMLRSLPEGSLRATTDMAEAVRNSEITCIIVPTPSAPDGRFLNDYVYAAIDEIGAALYGIDDVHTVVVCSTVMPGSTDGPIRVRLEEAAGRELSDSFGLVYSPEFIALGSVIYDMHNPDMVLIGESSGLPGWRYKQLVRTIVPAETVVHRMSIINAEIAKIAVNTFITMKISYANTLADIADKFDGGDAHAVAAAVGLDSRIGSKYLHPGTSYGGPCFPRDTRAFETLLPRAEENLARTTDRVNQQQRRKLTERLLLGPGRIGILGLAYKANTPVVEESAGMYAAKALLAAGREVTVYDPVAADEVWRELGSKVTYAKSVSGVYQTCDTVLIAVDHLEYCSVPRDYTGVVVDPWGSTRSKLG